MLKLIILSLVIIVSSCSTAQDLQEDVYPENKTFTHQELTLKYLRLQKEFPEKCRLLTYGKTDSGIKLQLFVINNQGQFNPSAIQRSEQNVLLINNAIHPGEPCGVDASVKLARELLRKKSIPNNLIVCIIPMYNIGGGTNRSCCSRANQEGPEDYGFRGNARNLDLNRDFIKMDSKNAREFATIFHDWKPNLFVDTHTSNGADYQHTMTLITTQLNKLDDGLAAFTRETLNPFLFNGMKKKGYPMVPYMHMVGKSPKDGIMDYLETPRYSTGYTAQFNCIGFVTEAHMLKPYKQRVESTYEFLKLLIKFSEANADELISIKQAADQKVKLQSHFPINYQLDTSQYELIDFLGYEAKYKTSEVTGSDRLYYDRSAPYQIKIKYFNHYRAQDTVIKPKFYIIPQAWSEVIDRLKLNRIPIQELQSDSIIEVESSYIKSFETVTRPYEGHYLHHDITVESKKQFINFRRGDYLIPTGFSSDRFLVECMEAPSKDSYFNWNFFDEILMQKEWFSPYVFEDKAAELLKTDPNLKAAFEKKKQIDKEFANDPRAQIYYIYKASPYYEKSHNRLPVFKIID